MEYIYCKQYQITDLHLDCFGRVKPSVLLYFAQEVAGEHAVQLGTDWETLNRKGLFWAVIRHRVSVTRLPNAGETVTVETWPMPTTRVAYPRATVCYDAQGQVLFRTVALWVLMDTQNRTLVLPGKSGVEVHGILRGREGGLPASLSPKQLANSTVRQVGYTLLDRNGHMNNTRYLDWIDDLLDSGYHLAHPVKEFTVCYLSEAREQEQLTLDWALSEEDILCVEAHRSSRETPGRQERVFAAEVHF